MKYFHTFGNRACVTLDVTANVKKVFQNQKLIISFHFVTHYSLGKSRLTVVSRVAKKNAHVTTTKSLFTRTKTY